MEYYILILYIKNDGENAIPILHSTYKLINLLPQ